MISIDDFVDSILTIIPTALEPTVEGVVREAAIRFCRETSLYKEVVALVADGSTAELTIIPPDFTRVRKLKNVWFTDNVNQRQRLASATPMNGAGFDDPRRGSVTQWYRDENVLHVNGLVSGTYTLDMRVIPTRNFIELPDYIGDDYFNAICAGALNLLFEMPEKPWTNAVAAATYGMTFSRGLMDAKHDANRSPERPVRKVKYSGI